MFVDLHLHTQFSDGTYTPEELAAQAKRHRLRAVALTDHDTVDGCARMSVACAEAGIEFIPATELTAELDDIELHLLGYYLDTGNRRLIRELSRFQAVRQDRIREMAARLNELGIPLEAATVFNLANCKSPGRPHVARALVLEQHCRSLNEAFERFLRKGKPAWVPKFKISATDAIELLHQSGALAVMAHPGLNRSDDMIPALVEAGLDGLECFHSKHSTPVTEHYMQLADRYNLLVTGGSDCHGKSKGKPLIGTIKVPYAHVEGLKARRRAKGHLPNPPPPPSPDAAQDPSGPDQP
jgi:predicted metal-dependent phosphoesterase TrpH